MSMDPLARMALEKFPPGSGANGGSAAREEAIQSILVDHLQLLKANNERAEREKLVLHQRTVQLGMVLRALLNRMSAQVILSQQELDAAIRTELDMKANEDGALVLRVTPSTEGDWS